MKTKYILFLAILLPGLLGMTSCKKFVREMLVKTGSVDPTTYLAQAQVVDCGTGSVQYGFCYGTTSSPGMTDNVITVGTSSSARSYQAYLTNVVSGTYNYARAFARGSDGTVYGDVIKFYVQGGGGTVEYYWDSGTADNGWMINPGYDGYLGNYFPVSTSGYIVSVKMYFTTGTNRYPVPVNVVFFDANTNVMGSTSNFTNTANTWLTQSASSISFSGAFYAMVHWSYVSDSSNYLGIDYSGPNVSMNLAYHHSGSSWNKISTYSSKNGIFLLRVTAQVTGMKNTVELLPVPGPLNIREIPDNEAYEAIRRNPVELPAGLCQFKPSSTK